MAGEAFELERFEWTDDKRIEVEGRWVGVRGRRFVRPTLTLRGAGDERRVLALLEHKPWDPGVTDWQAAFALDGDVTDFEEAELAVAPGLEVTLPAPRQLSAKRSRRKAKRYEAHAGVVETVPAAPAGGSLQVKPAPAPRVEYSAQLLDDLATLRAHTERVEAELEDTRAERDRLAAERTALEAQRDDLATELERANSAVALGEDELTRAIREREEMAAERDSLLPGRDVVARERSALQLKLDAAIRARDALREERDAALAELDAAIATRNTALAEREQVKRTASYASLPRSSIYTSTAQHSFLARWTPRLIAVAIVITFVVVVLLLFH